MIIRRARVAQNTVFDKRLHTSYTDACQKEMLTNDSRKTTEIQDAVLRYELPARTSAKAPYEIADAYENNLHHARRERHTKIT